LPERSFPERWFLGTRFHDIDLHHTLALLRDRPPAAPFVYVTTPNAQHVVRIQHGHAGNIAANDRAWLSTCDSRVLARLALLLFRIRLPLVAGSDLTVALFDGRIDPHDPLCVIGGDASLEAGLRSQIGLARLALFDPPFGFWRSDAGLDEAAAFVEAHPSRFVFLACGAPQSELLAVRLVDRGLATGIGLCVGASLKFVTGQARRAPRLFQLAGLEWLHRLLSEPRRLWRRFAAEQLPVLWVAARFRMQPGFASDHRRRDLWR
jgi:exopolysaccharide biosynthesis WecB/TagA/CpsF family protein